jgi:hypothetical protein
MIDDLLCDNLNKWNLVREGKGKFLEQFGSHQESSATSEISART